MKNINKILLTLLIPILLFSCSNNEVYGNEEKVDKIEKPKKGGLKEGGLYTYKSTTGKFKVNKILVLDEEYEIVHLRPYDKEFDEKPMDISSKDLEYLIGHIPLSKKGFLENNPELIKVEKVSEEELEGYRYYLEAMKSQ